MKSLAAVIAATLATALDASAASAAEDAKPGAAQAEGKTPMVKERMREKEPMTGGMKREGMMKEDVRVQAEKKDKVMREIMEKEAAGRK
jgi:Spy/CpxP family protein refolding chaperone